MIVAGLLIAAAAAAEAPPTGVWVVERGDGAIEIAPCDDGVALCGRLVWMKPNDAAPPKRDVNNPDPARRGEPLCGLTLMTGFRQDEGGAWVGGRIYNPEDGHFYDARFRRDGEDRLKLRGFLLISALGATETWTRAPEDLGRCDRGQ